MDTGVIERRTASSGNVDYGMTRVLDENSRTRVVATPFFIKHSDRSTLKIKLTTLKKAQPPMQWVEIDEKSISLSEEATSNLLLFLSEQEALTEACAGKFLSIRLDDGVPSLGDIDPEFAARALFDALNDKEVASHLHGVELGSELLKALRYSVRLDEMKSAMMELRLHLEGGDVLESIYQKWCESHPWAFGNQFVVNDDIRNISTKDQVDLLLPRIAAGYRDIIELKRPDMPVLKYDSGHDDFYFSSDVAKAIGQCHRYLDVFVDVASHGLIADSSVVAYHPEATIVIGRSNDWDEVKMRALHGLNSRLNGIRVVTYDFLLAQGESLVDYLSNNVEFEGA